MGKNLFKKLIATLVMVFGAVTVFSACSKNPYKNMKLSVDKKDVEITYTDDETNADEITFTISATVSGVGKNVSKEVYFVVGNDSIIAPATNDYIKYNDGKTTATFIATPNGGSTYIDVLTLEGNLRERVNVSVIIPVTGMVFSATTLPIERGVKTDITAKFDGVSTGIQDRIIYTPQNTTQKDVEMSAVYVDGSSIPEDIITIDGNYITIDSDITNFKLVVRNKENSDLTAEVECQVVDPVTVDDITLYEGNSIEDGVLTADYESGKRVFSVNLANITSNQNDSKTKTIKVALEEGDFDDNYTMTVVPSSADRNFKVYDNGDNTITIDQGVGNKTEYVDLMINYKEHSDLFAPKYIRLKVNVCTFPSELKFVDDKGENLTSVDVYKNYRLPVEGSTTTLRVLSGEEVLAGQSAYLTVMAGDEEVSGVSLWYKLSGVNREITSTTAVKHGTKIYIKYSPTSLTNTASDIKLVATSTVDDTKTAELKLNIIKNEVAPSFVNLETNQINIEVDKTFDLTTQTGEDVYVSLGDTDVKLSSCSIKFDRTDIVSCELNGDNYTLTGLKEGKVTGTITAPNGEFSTFTVLVYVDYTADTLGFRIGDNNYKFVGEYTMLGDGEKITMQTSSSFGIKLIKFVDIDDPDNFDPDEAKYEIVAQSSNEVPENISFEKIEYGEGTRYITIGLDDKLIIRSNRDKGSTTVTYTLKSTKYNITGDGDETELYIRFKVIVEARLTKFTVTDEDGKVAESFTIVTDKSIEAKESEEKKTAVLYVVPNPDNVELDVENISFQVSYKNKTDVIKAKDGTEGEFEYTCEDNSGKQISNFRIKVEKDGKRFKLTFTCEELGTDITDADIRITIIYEQEFVDISGGNQSSQNRLTTINGRIENAIKITKVEFEDEAVNYNTNQLELDGEGKVTNEDRAKTTIGYNLTFNGDQQYSKLTVKGFLLFWSEDKEDLNINDYKEAVEDDDYYTICDGNIKVTLDETHNTIEIQVLKWTKEDVGNSLIFYLVPKSFVHLDSNGEDVFYDISDKHIASDSGSASLKITFRDGTEDNRFLVKDAYDLQYIDKALSSHYQIVNNILIDENTNWTPIGGKTPFTGSVITTDYQIFTISGLKLNKSVLIADALATATNKYIAYYGLFGCIGKDAEISNLRLENCQVSITYDGNNIGNDNSVDVYVGAFAGLNLGTLTNISVEDDTQRGYNSLKGNILNTLVYKDENDRYSNSIAYRPEGINTNNSNLVFVGGMVGVNGGKITTSENIVSEVNATLFVRDQQADPAKYGYSTVYAGGVVGANVATQYGSGKGESGVVENIDVYSLINATLVDETFSGWIKNKNSVLGGVAGINMTSHTTGDQYTAKLSNIDCRTIIIGFDNIGGVVGQNYGTVESVSVVPHLYGKDYVGGVAGVNANVGTGTTYAKLKTDEILTGQFGLNKKAGTDEIYYLSNTSDEKYASGNIYYSKVKFVDALDQLSFFNSSIVARNYVGGLVGYQLDVNAEKYGAIDNISKLSMGTQNASIAYSSVNTYFVVSSANTNDTRKNIASVDNDAKNYLHQLTKTKADRESYTQNNTGLYYGDIVIVNDDTESKDNLYVGGIVGISDGGYDSNKTDIENYSAGGVYVNVYFNANVVNTYNTANSEYIKSPQNNDQTSTVFGGFAGKTNGILFVYNANILGTVSGTNIVGGFVGDSSDLYDRLKAEKCTPYTTDGNGFYAINDTTNKFSGKYNINNSYTLLQNGTSQVQNFAYYGEDVENESNSGYGNGQVNAITFNTSSQYGGDSGTDYIYYDKTASATISYYAGQQVSSTTTKKVAYRRILQYMSGEDGKDLTVAVQNGYKNKQTEPTYITSDDTSYNADEYKSDIFQKGDEKTYYYQTTTEGQDGETITTTTSIQKDEYKKLYYSNSTTAPTYTTLAKIKEDTNNGDWKTDGDYVYNNVSRYRKTDYYICKIDTSKTYYSDEDCSTEVTVYTDAKEAYVEVEPNYETKVLQKYYDGEKYYYFKQGQSTGTWKNANDKTSINGQEYPIYTKDNSTTTKYLLASKSSITDYAVDNTIYESISISGGKITFKSKDGGETTTVNYDGDYNIYHMLINYVVNGGTLSPIKTGGSAGVNFSYKRLTASNSFYDGFKTKLFDEDGKALQENDKDKIVEFTKANADKTTLTTTDGTQYSYYSSNWHYTNISVGNLTKENDDNKGFGDYYIQYENETKKSFEVEEYFYPTSVGDVQNLITGTGPVAPSKFIKSYDFDSYSYKVYEGSGDTGLTTPKPNGEYLYHNAEVNGGIPLSFGKYQENEDELNLIVDLAPQGMSATPLKDYKVDSVKKNDDILEIDTDAPKAIMLDYSIGKNNRYGFVNSNSSPKAIDVTVLPSFVGYGSIKVTSNNENIVAVEKVVNGTNSSTGYNLITKSVGYAIVTITSELNNALSCDIVVMVKESVDGLTYTYSTTTEAQTITQGGDVSVLKNNSSVFAINGKNEDDDVLLQNMGVEYEISGVGSVFVNGKTYTKGVDDKIKFVTYSTENTFKVTEGFGVKARPFYLYEVKYNSKTYLYRKYVDANTGVNKIDIETFDYNVNPSSFAYNIYAPNDITMGIASQTSFDLIVNSNDEILVDVELEFGFEEETETFTIKTTKDGSSYESCFVDKDRKEYDDSITVGGLTIEWIETIYNTTTKKHTLSFVGYVLNTNYDQITNPKELNVTCTIKSTYDGTARDDKFDIMLLPFQVENVRMSHYTKFWYDEAQGEEDDYETTYKSYKYASDKIVPGYNSLLQVDISPSYGQFDYAVIEIVGANNSIIRQIVEDKSKDSVAGVSVYADFDKYDNVDNMSNKIKVVQKYSYVDNDEYGWDGSLLFALNLDSKYTDASVTVTINGYTTDGTLKFTQSKTLDVVGVPSVAIKWDNSADNCYSTTNTASTEATVYIGGELPITLTGSNYDSVEFEVDANIGVVEVRNGKYYFKLNEWYKDKVKIECTVSRVVDGVEYTSSSTIYAIPVYYLVMGLQFEVDKEENQSDTVDSLHAYYNQTKDIKITVVAKYDIKSLNEPGKLTDIEAELVKLGEDITKAYSDTQNGKQATYLWKNQVGDKTKDGLLTGDYSNRGYIIGYDDEKSCFTIKIAQNTVKDDIVANVTFNYINGSAEIVDDAYAGEQNIVLTHRLTLVIEQSSATNYIPIKSVDDFKAMKSGQDYILLTDLVLSNWEPMDATFKTFDGNGYTITITSFGDVEGLENVGLFTTIGDDDASFTTTVQNLTIDICPVMETADGKLYIDQTGVLSVNIGATSEVNVGVLAGTNYGIITNVTVTNNAQNIRKNREASLNDTEYEEISTEDFTKYFDSDKAFTDGVKGSETINLNSDFNIDTFSVITSSTKETLGLNVGGLVGHNTSVGYITNSCVERVNVKGIDYVAGFVAKNQGYISSSYFKAGSVISNDKQTKENSATAGFVALHESGKIQYCYVLGSETQDAYDQNSQITGSGNKSINAMTTYIDKNSKLLVINSNSQKYSETDTLVGKIEIDISEYAGYNLFVAYKTNGKNEEIANLRALGSAVYTNNTASGFVGENSAFISNCYSNILISGTNGAGFAYTNDGEIESSYSMSSIKNNNSNYYPFTKSGTELTNCYYLYVNESDDVVDNKDSFSMANDDVATALSAQNFSDYNTFTSWGFNSDYSTNKNLDDGVWFIPKTGNEDGFSNYLKQFCYTIKRPELVSANIYTVSLKYYVNGDDETGEYNYTDVDKWIILEENVYLPSNKLVGGKPVGLPSTEGNSRSINGKNGAVLTISKGSFNNPLLIKTAEDFNANLQPANGKSGVKMPTENIVRMVHDVTFDEIQVANTFNTDFNGNFEGNGLSINNLRILAGKTDESETITFLGLFRSIRSNGKVRNLTINIEEIYGSNINFVGVLAGAIDGSKIYNITVNGANKDIKVEGLNAVGGIAGIILNKAEIVNFKSNVSVQANAINKINIFDPSRPNVKNNQFKMFASNYATKGGFDLWELDEVGQSSYKHVAETIEGISYAGGIAGIIDVDKNSSSNDAIDFTDRIRECIVSGDIKISGDVVGGVAGYVGENTYLSNSKFIVDEDTELNALRIGGAIVGHNEGYINRVAVRYENQNDIDKNFYSSEDNTKNNEAFYKALDNATTDVAQNAYTSMTKSDLFTGNAHYIGGIVGSNIGGSIENSYSRVDVVNAKAGYAGGLVGQNVGGLLDSVYTTGSVYGYFATGGIIGIEPAIMGAQEDTTYNEESIKKLYLDDQFGAESYAENIYEIILSLLKRTGKNSEKDCTYTEGSKDVKIYNPKEIQTEYANLVGANIWRRQDINPVRAQYNSTQKNAYLGVFVGYMTDVSGKDGYKEPIKYNDITTRLSDETTYFKQTYTYLNPNSLIQEIGNIAQTDISDKVTSQDLITDDNRMVSGDYEMGGDKYRYSRLRYYGSLRSLNEIICRIYNLSDANELWSRVDEGQNETGIGDTTVPKIYRRFNTYNWNGISLSNSNEIQNDIAGVRDVFPSISENLKPDYIPVYNQDDLEQMRSYTRATFKLMNDIELKGSWEPVGTEDKPFSGTLDGNGFTISNLNMNSNNEEYFGFIAVSNNATIKNLNIEANGIYCNAQDDNKESAQADNFTIAGGILIGLAQKTKINGVNIKFSSSGEVAIHNTQYVGGLIGFSGTKNYGLDENNDQLPLEGTNNACTIKGTNSITGLATTKFYSTMFGDKNGLKNYYFGGAIGNSIDSDNLSGITVENMNIIISDSGYTSGFDYADTENETYYTDTNNVRVRIGGVVGSSTIQATTGTQSTTSSSLILNNTTISISNLPTTTNVDVGGVVGYSDSATYSNITTDSSKLIIIKDGKYIEDKIYTYNIGGVFGQLAGDASAITSDTSVTVAALSKIEYNIGGVVGSIGQYTLSNSEYKSTITVKHESGMSYLTLKAGGIVGSAMATTISNAKVNSYSGSGATFKKNDIIKVEDNYTNSSGKIEMGLGGIVGSADIVGDSKTTLTNCTAIGVINHPKTTTNGTVKANVAIYIGGAVGYDNSSSITKVGADVDVNDDRYTTNSGVFEYGGLVGLAQGTTISSSYAGGNLTSQQHMSYAGNSLEYEWNGTYIGGLVGCFRADNVKKIVAKIENSYSVAKLTFTNFSTYFTSTKKGGVVGKCVGDDYTINNTYYVKDFVPYSNDYGTGISVTELKTKLSSFTTGTLIPTLSGHTFESGSNLNPITNYNNVIDISNNKTVYLKTGNLNNYVVEEGSYLVLMEGVTGNRLVGSNITNNGYIIGVGKITTLSSNTLKIKNSGYILGLKDSETVDGTNIEITEDGSKSYVYASMFRYTGDDVLKFDQNSTFTNCAIYDPNNAIYKPYPFDQGDNFILTQKLDESLRYSSSDSKGYPTLKSLTLLQAQNVDMMDGLKLDLTRWAKVANKNSGVLVPAWLYKDHYYDEYYTGSSYATTPSYSVDTAEEFVQLARAINEGKYSNDITINLTDDIDLGDYPWTPISTKLNVTLDGGGHTIKNLSVVTETYGGLFGTMTGNLTVNNLRIGGIFDVLDEEGNKTDKTTNCGAQIMTSDTSGYSAVIVGYAKGNVTLKKVAIEDAHLFGNKMAGFVGKMTSGTLNAKQAYVVTSAYNPTTSNFAYVLADAGISVSVTLNETYFVKLKYDTKTTAYTPDNKEYYLALDSSGKMITLSNYSYMHIGYYDEVFSVDYLNKIKTSGLDSLFGTDAVKRWTQDSELNYGLPQLSMSAQYWIDDGAKSENAVSPSDNTYTITTAEQLAWVAYQVNNVEMSFSGKTIKVTKNIDLAGKLWTPIGISSKKSFKGKFEVAENVIISNLNCKGAFNISSKRTDLENASTYADGFDKTYGGLFGYAVDATFDIKGTLTKFTVQDVKYAGLLVAQLSTESNNSTISVNVISDSSAYANNETNSSAGTIANITGIADKYAIIKVTNANNLTVSGRRAGGLIGSAEGGGVQISASKVLNSAITAIMYNSTATVPAGGLVGYLNNDKNYSIIYNSKVSNISLNGSCLGGLVGYGTGDKGMIISAVKVETLKVTKEEQTDTIQYFGGVAGSINYTTIQNATVVNGEDAIYTKFGTTASGGVAGKVTTSQISEVKIDYMGESLSVETNKGAVAGSIDKYTYVQNIELVASSNETGDIKVFFGSDTKNNNSSLTMCSIWNGTKPSHSNSSGFYTTGKDSPMIQSSAWDYKLCDSEYHLYTLKSNGTSLASNFTIGVGFIGDYAVQNSDKDTVVVPYRNSSVSSPIGNINLKDVTITINVEGQWDALVTWWTYRDGDNKINIEFGGDTDGNSSPIIKSPLGTDKFPYSGSLSQTSESAGVALDISKSTSDYVGLIGYATYLSVTGDNDLTLSGSVEGQNYVGALVGYLKASETCTIKNVTSTATVTGKTYVGGLVGLVDIDKDESVKSYLVTIDTCKVLGLGSSLEILSSVTEKTNVHIGGIAGKINNTIITGCIIQNVTISDTKLNTAILGSKCIDYAGGIVGSANRDNTEGRCSYNTIEKNSVISVTIYAHDYVGGIVGQITIPDLGESDSDCVNVNNNTVQGCTINGNSYVAGMCGYLNALGNGHYVTTGVIANNVFKANGSTGTTVKYNEDEKNDKIVCRSTTVTISTYDSNKGDTYCTLTQRGSGSGSGITPSTPLD